MLVQSNQHGNFLYSANLDSSDSQPSLRIEFVNADLTQTLQPVPFNARAAVFEGYGLQAVRKCFEVNLALAADG
jgi:hypothetical protein